MTTNYNLSVGLCEHMLGDVKGKLWNRFRRKSNVHLPVFDKCGYLAGQGPTEGLGERPGGFSAMAMAGSNEPLPQ